MLDLPRSAPPERRAKRASPRGRALGRCPDDPARQAVSRVALSREAVSRVVLTLVALSLGALSLGAGCAPALPSFAGGRTVPRDRNDLAVGAALRVPVGDLVAEPSGEDRDVLLAAAAPGGVAPLAFVRHGLTRDVDLGVEVSGTTLRAAARGQIRVGTVSLMGALEPYGGLANEGASLGRVGAALPLTLGLDVLSVVEVWLGVRAALEHVFGDSGGATPRAVSLIGLRTGGVVGLAVGFRRFHVLAELGVDHELWVGELDGRSFTRNGVALTPAFGLRLRL